MNILDDSSEGFILKVDLEYPECLHDLHKDFRLITKWEGRYGAKSLIARPNFHSCTISDENMVIIKLNRLEINFNKPINIGFRIFDISKIIIYDYHYNYMKKNFGNNVKLLYTDTV